MKKEEKLSMIDWISKMLLTGLIGVGISGGIHNGETYYQEDKSSKDFLLNEEKLNKTISILEKIMVELNSSENIEEKNNTTNEKPKKTNRASSS